MTLEQTKTDEIIKWFEQINQIPRCSKNEGAIRDWLMNWAKENRFAVVTDKVQNLLIKVPASPGYEKSPIVVLQGHLDMVCEKTSDSEHDFTTDPIKLIYEGEWLTADKTTLGADNGIAIALAMALALDKEVSHPPLELLFTVDEETGLVGASALELGFFDGRILINIDSEVEGHFTVGCAGGFNTDITVPIDWRDIPTDFQLMKVNASGMTGGHSGVDINAEKANAIKVLNQTLYALTTQIDIRLANISGGSAHNAIPRDAEAWVFVPQNQTETVETIVQATETRLKSEYQNTDPDLFIKIEAGEGHYDQAMTLEKTAQIIDFIMVLPHGVSAMFTDMKQVVETSNNLANICIEAGKLKIITSQRSSRLSRLEALTHRIEACTRLAGGEAHSEVLYPAWQPNSESPLLAKSVEIYERLFDKKPIVEVMHAGLECGIIGDNIPGMDMISIGPTIKYPHSPDEKLLMASVGKIWVFLRALLKETAGI
ncbi:MAG: aminoacyl-histidine dipeptidase [Candidatus Parabeggiatoa sp.]|nr:aminoacyl-histidine dipeptidase [Candidatus Parabeggiatoa sp.]